MALFTEAEVRSRAKAGTPFQKTATMLLAERVHLQNSISQHDIFLSHAYEDREIVYGIALMIEDLGYSVYIDWRDDPYLDRSRVSPETANRLRARMKTSRCLFYSTTNNSIDSKWMPWELGFKDGNNARVAILPVARYETSSYQGQEYLGIYPYIDLADNKSGKRRLWVHSNPSCYVNFEDWLKGSEPKEKA